MIQERSLLTNQKNVLRLNRMTSIEREEKEKVKKREKKLEDEETLQQATWVKYTFPIKHQVGLKLAHTHTCCLVFFL